MNSASFAGLRVVQVKIRPSRCANSLEGVGIPSLDIGYGAGGDDMNFLVLFDFFRRSSWDTMHFPFGWSHVYRALLMLLVVMMFIPVAAAVGDDE
jgi:hypothetical protein